MDAASTFQPVALADVEAAQRGDQSAFTRLVESTCVLVSSIAVAIAHDPDVSRDIAQDVFLSAWHDIGKLREPSSFLPWLRQITRNRARHVLRTTRRRGLRIAEHEASELLEAVVDPRPNADQRLIAEERLRSVRQALELLPEETREVMTLFYREGQSVAHVAVPPGPERGGGPTTAVTRPAPAARRPPPPLRRRPRQHRAGQRVRSGCGRGPCRGCAGAGVSGDDWGHGREEPWAGRKDRRSGRGHRTQRGRWHSGHRAGAAAPRAHGVR